MIYSFSGSIQCVAPSREGIPSALASRKRTRLARHARLLQLCPCSAGRMFEAQHGTAGRRVPRTDVEMCESTQISQYCSPQNGGKVDHDRNHGNRSSIC